jgi:TonB-dependent SusC/RagA subfamily outer membrane receptor
MKLILSSILILLLCWSCSTSEATHKPYMGNTMVTQDGVSSIENVDNTQTWATHLRRLPGVSVSGQGENLKVRIRAQNNSFMLDSSPLFVLDGMALGNDFRALTGAININDVASISVLKNASETSMWGLRGANGVIVVKSKRPGQH